MGTSSRVKRLYSVKVFVTGFSMITYLRVTVFNFEGLESSFHALDLIVSQHAPRRTRGQHYLERSSKRGALKRSLKRG